LRGDGVCKISSRGAADGGEIETARSGERRGHHAILKGKRREAHGVVFEMKLFQAPLRRKFARRHQRRATDGVNAGKVLRQREKLGIAPHIEITGGESFAASDFFQGIIVVGDFQRRKAVFAEGARSVAPGFAAFPTS
jgi:hypothetical protein